MILTLRPSTGSVATISTQAMLFWRLTVTEGASAARATGARNKLEIETRHSIQPHSFLVMSFLS
jgi:hypothetical protein